MVGIFFLKKLSRNVDMRSDKESNVSMTSSMENYLWLVMRKGD